MSRDRSCQDWANTLEQPLLFLSLLVSLLENLALAEELGLRRLLDGGSLGYNFLWLTAEVGRGLAGL